AADRRAKAGREPGKRARTGDLNEPDRNGEQHAEAAGHDEQHDRQPQAVDDQRQIMREPGPVHDRLGELGLAAAQPAPDEAEDPEGDERYDEVEDSRGEEEDEIVLGAPRRLARLERELAVAHDRDKG